MSDPNVAPSFTPSGGETPATPVAAPTTPSFAPSVAPTPIPAAAPIAAPEDRSNWVPPHRLREIREASQRQWSEREANYQAQLEHYQNQVRALTGMQPPPNQEYEPIRQQFGQVFGDGAMRLFDKAEQIEQSLERMRELENAVNYIWKNHASQSLDRVFKSAEESLGSPLTPEGKQALHAAFSGWVQTVDPQGERYVNDPTLIDEFWKALSSTLVDPARRAAAVNTVSRVPGALPQDTPGGGAPPVSPAPKLSGLDERANAAWAQFQHSKNG